MSFFFSSWWTELYFVVFFGFFCYYVYFKLYLSKYWKNRKVPFENPVFILGNLWKTGIFCNFGEAVDSIYKKWEKEKMIGVWSFSKPNLILTDLELIKTILVKDFKYFRDHGFEFDFEKEPLAGHLFNLKGSKWKSVRVKLTPTFTSGKMKMMFPTMVDCGEKLQSFLNNIAKDGMEVEVKDILSRYTTDIIASCAFGVETNSLKNPNSDFRVFGKKFFEPRLLRIFIFNFNTKFIQALGIPLLPKDITKFFLNTVKDVMEYREKNQVERKDFLQLLIQLKNKGKVDNMDDNGPVDTGDDDLSVEDMKFGYNEAAAQAFVFFIAGFETSSTTLTFSLYELALNTEIQDKLQEEMDEILSKVDNKITYEAIMEMEYMSWVVQETLRKYPPVPILLRKCTQDYRVPNTDIQIDKGTQLLIPVSSIQRDPKFFSNPEKYDPTRFSPEEKSKRDHFTSLYFGEGPRICIGNRFGLLQVKVGLISILSRYNVRVSKQTPIPLTIDPRTFILSPKGGMHLKFELRSK